MPHEYRSVTQQLMGEQCVEVTAEGAREAEGGEVGEAVEEGGEGLVGDCEGGAEAVGDGEELV